MTNQKLERKRVFQELEQIRKRHDGLLRPADVIEAARNPKSHLHHKFTWDDSEAAHQWRLAEARALIRVHVTVIHHDVSPVRAYVSLVPDRIKPGGGYRPIDEVLSDDEKYQQLLDQAKREMRIFAVKYGQIKELQPVIAAMRMVNSGDVCEVAV